MTRNSAAAAAPEKEPQPEQQQQPQPEPAPGPEPAPAKAESNPPPASPSAPLPLALLLLALLPAVLAGFFVADDPVAKLLQLRPPCELGTRCAWYARRPALPGSPHRLSTRLWDLPRERLVTEWGAVAPNSRVVWREPAVVIFDDVVMGTDVEALLNAAQGRFDKPTVVNEDGKEVEDLGRTSETAFLDCHNGDAAVGSVVDKVVRMLGFPGKAFAEGVEVNRYNESQGFAIHYDWLTDNGVNDGSDHDGCQRVATALIYLTDVQEGGDNVFVRDPAFKGGFQDINRASSDHEVIRPKMGRLLAWYNVHPMTEGVDHRTWHGSSPVKQGVKIAATVYIRNCSLVFNKKRMELIRAIRDAQPVSSAVVPEETEGLDDDEEYDYDEDDDEGDFDDDDEFDDEGFEDVDEEDIAEMDDEERELFRKWQEEAKLRKEKRQAREEQGEVGTDIKTESEDDRSVGEAEVIDHEFGGGKGEDFDDDDDDDDDDDKEYYDDKDEDGIDDDDRLGDDYDEFDDDIDDDDEFDDEDEFDDDEFDDVEFDAENVGSAVDLEDMAGDSGMNEDDYEDDMDRAQGSGGQCGGGGYDDEDEDVYNPFEDEGDEAPGQCGGGGYGDDDEDVYNPFEDEGDEVPGQCGGAGFGGGDDAYNVFGDDDEDEELFGEFGDGEWQEMGMDSDEDEEFEPDGYDSKRIPPQPLVEEDEADLASEGQVGGGEERKDEL